MQLQRHTLDNGLSIVLQRDTRLPLVAVNLWYRVGSINERPGHTGFAHLFEHMLFQGSEHVGDNDHFRYVQQVGGVANGSTWYDRTNYYETLPASHLELGLWLESDRMGFLLPAMTEDKLESQRSVVMNERRQRVDNQPYGKASERLNELLYPKEHPYHWPVIGYMDDIAAATLDEVRDFFETYYVPSNAVLTLVGDFDPERALVQVERYFDAIDARDSPPVPKPPAPLSLRGREPEVLEDEVSLPRAYLAFCVPGYGSEPWYAASLLATVLGEGKASPLFRELIYEQQIAHNVGCYVLPTRACATLCVVATGKPDATIEQLHHGVAQILNRVAEGSLLESDRQRALNTLLTAHQSDLQTLDSRADSISMGTTFFDRPDYSWSEPERYRAAGLKDLRDCVVQFCQPEMAASVSVVPSDR